MSAARFPSWVDGRLVAPGEPAIAADAAGLSLGLGLFETLLCVRGLRRFEGEHLARLERGAAFLGLRFAAAAGRRALAELGAALGAAAQVDEPGLVLRLTLLAADARAQDAGGAPAILVATAREPEPPPPGGVEVVLEPRALLARDPLGSLKSVARPRHLLARRRARTLGAWDALLGSDEGDVLEASVANLFLARGGRLITPALARGCLPGLTRGRLLAALRGQGLDPLEGRIEPEDLESAEEVFLTNSVAGVVPVRVVQGLREDLPGPEGRWVGLATRLLAAIGPGADKGARRGPVHPPSAEETP